MLVRELVHPFLGVCSHNLKNICRQTVISCVLEQCSNCVFYAHNLIAKRVHAQLFGRRQRLAEVLVGFANVEPFAATVEQSLAQLLCDWFGEVVIRLYDDVLVVPGEVYQTYTSES